MAKNRRKKHRKRQGGQAAVPPLPRPSRARNQGAALRPDAVAARVAAEPSMPHKVGDVVSATVTDFRDDGGLSLDVDGLVGIVPLGELNLADSESTQDRYAIGETIEDLFVWGSDHEFRLLALSLKRNAPGYVDALQRRAVGEVVFGTVTLLANNGGLWLDVDGLVGWVAPDELVLNDGESAQGRYAVDQTIEGLFVWQINHETRDLRLSVKRNTPGYVEALQRRAIGDVVSGTVTVLANNGGLWLDVDGLVGWVAPDELVLNDGESAQERYAVGETIKDLLVQAVNQNGRNLRLSIKRNAPGYVEALQRRATGEVVSGTVTAFQSNDGLWLDVDGLVGSVAPDELTLASGESAQERYAVGETIDGLFVWGIDHEDRVLSLSGKRNAPGYVEALQRRAIGNVVSGTITSVGEGLWLDVDGLVGWVAPDELVLNDGESAQERYTVGETIEGLFVWGIDHKDRHLALSAKRGAPGYAEALRRHVVGEVVSATITGFDGDDGLWLDVDGLVGGIPPGEFALADGESARDRYAVGETIDSLFVWDIDHETHHLGLSAKRNAPGYIEALQRRTVGDVVSAAVTGFQGNDGLLLDVDGLVGGIPPWELALADGESAQNRYAIGETIDGLFVWQVNHEFRVLNLSTKRNAPGYAKALQQRTVGDVVSAIITGFEGGGGLWIDVDGQVGGVGSEELVLADGESARERYTIGDTINGLFVLLVDHEARDLHLSVKRNTPDYIEALQQRTVGEVVSGTIAQIGTYGLVVDVYGLLGVVLTSELSLDDGQSSQQQYSVGDTIAARVWMIDRMSRTVILLARRHAAGIHQESVAQGATIEVVVRGTTPRDVRMPIRVLTPYSDSRVEIPPHALSLSTGIPPRFEDNQAIRVVVVELDDEGRPMRLSHRRTLDGWEAEGERLSPGVLIPRARVAPLGALSDTELREGSAAVDLGPITGFISEDELDLDSGLALMTYSGNETYGVVIESVDRERGIAIVSHDRFEERWRELAAGFEVGAEVAGELRDVEGRVALLELGSGLLAEMPMEQLPARTEGGGVEQDRIGETVTVQIKSIEAETYTIAAEIKNYDLMQMIAADETLVCELKKVFLASVQPESPSARRNRQDVNRSVVRAMAGMMNRGGGHVIVGVEDTDKKDGEVVGWEASGWENQNKMATALSNLVGRVLSAAAGGLYEARFERLPDGHEVLDIVCRRADEPIFLSDGQREEFPVRFPAMTKNLTARDQHEYIQQRFYG